MSFPVLLTIITPFMVCFFAWIAYQVKYAMNEDRLGTTQQWTDARSAACDEWPGRY